MPFFLFWTRGKKYFGNRKYRFQHEDLSIIVSNASALLSLYVQMFLDGMLLCLYRNCLSYFNKWYSWFIALKSLKTGVWELIRDQFRSRSTTVMQSLKLVNQSCKLVSKVLWKNILLFIFVRLFLMRSVLLMRILTVLVKHCRQDGAWCMVLYHSLSPWFTKLLIVHRRLSPFLKNYKSFHHSIPKYSTEIQGSWNLLCSSNRLIGTRALYHLFYHFIIKSLKEKTTKRVRTYLPLGQGRFTDTPD